MTAEAAVPAERAAQVSLGALARYFLRLGTFGFGGPIALTAAMQRDLVLERRWVTAEEYKEGLALAQLAPGPLAAQLAIYLGWVRQGVLGATLVGLAFVGPSFLMVLVLSAFYLRFGELAWMQGAFYGIGAAVIAIVARGTGKLLRSSIGRDPLLWAVVVVNAAVVAWTEAEILWVFALSGLVVLAWRLWRESGRRAGPAAAAMLPLVARHRPARAGVGRDDGADPRLLREGRRSWSSAAGSRSCPSSTAAWSATTAGSPSASSSMRSRSP